MRVLSLRAHVLCGCVSVCKRMPFFCVFLRSKQNRSWGCYATFKKLYSGNYTKSLAAQQDSATYTHKNTFLKTQMHCYC